MSKTGVSNGHLLEASKTYTNTIGETRWKSELNTCYLVVVLLSCRRLEMALGICSDYPLGNLMLYNNDTRYNDMPLSNITVLSELRSWN